MILILHLPSKFGFFFHSDYIVLLLLPLLNAKQIGQLEAIQSRALKIIVGFEHNSETARQMCGLEKISERFHKLTESFVWKEYQNGNKRQWFQERLQLSQMGH